MTVSKLTLHMLYGIIIPNYIQGGFSDVGYKDQDLSKNS